MNNLSPGLEVAPCIYVYENIIDNSEEIIGLAKDSKEISKAEIYGQGDKLYVNSEIRDVDMAYFPPTFSNDIRWFALSQKIWQYANQYAMQHNISFSNMEYLQFLNYQPSAGFYTAHFDSGPSAPRIISAVLYLNDVEEGGETYFNRFDVGISPRSGRLVLFPSNFVYLHEAKRPISNEKNAIITFFNI